MKPKHPKKPPLFSKQSGAEQAKARDEATGLRAVFVHSRLDEYGLKPSEFRVYCHVARRDGGNGAWSAIDDMARVCRLHPQTVRKSLQLLVLHRLLVAEPRSGDTTLYFVTLPSAWEPPFHVQADVSATRVAPSLSPKSLATVGKGHPSEKRVVKGNPSEVNLKKYKYIHTQGFLPTSEQDALRRAKAFGIPDDFVIQEYNRMVAVGWLDGCRRAVTSWEHYIKQRWTTAQRERGERAVRPRSSGHRPPQPPRQFSKGDYDQPI